MHKVVGLGLPHLLVALWDPESLWKREDWAGAVVLNPGCTLDSLLVPNTGTLAPAVLGTVTLEGLHLPLTCTLGEDLF